MLKAAVVLLCVATAAAQRFPGATWERATPESQGMDSARLRAAFDGAMPPTSLTTYCAAVFRNGYLIMDRYIAGSQPQDVHITWSVSKAVFSTLIGIAEKAGWLRASDLASRYIPEWQNDARANRITIDHLLRHDSGRYFDPITDFIIAQTVPNQTEFGIGLSQQRDPGAADVYNQMAFQSMERIWRRAAPGRVVDLFDQLLARPLQFQSRTFWDQVSFIVNVPNGDGGLIYGGMRTSCQDLGRFGHLWLHGGNWAGREIITPEFYRRALERAPAPRAGRRYHWGGGPNFRATGLGNQFVLFNRERNLVITRLGDMTGLGFNSGQFIDRVMQSIDDGVGSWNATQDEIDNPEDPAEIAMQKELLKLLHESTERSEQI